MALRGVAAAGRRLHHTVDHACLQAAWVDPFGLPGETPLALHTIERVRRGREDLVVGDLVGEDVGVLAVLGGDAVDVLLIQDARVLRVAVEVAVAVIMHFKVTPEDEQRWRQTAASKHLGLQDWLRTVADAAARDELTHSEPPASRPHIARGQVKHLIAG